MAVNINGFKNGFFFASKQKVFSEAEHSWESGCSLPTVRAWAQRCPWWELEKSNTSRNVHVPCMREDSGICYPPPRLCWCLAPPPAPAVYGMRVTCLAPGIEDKHNAGGEGAQVFSFLLCFYSSALNEEWICKLPNGTFSMLVGELRAPRSSWCVCGSGEVLQNFRTTPCPVLGYVFVVLHPPSMGLGTAIPRHLLRVMCSIDCSQLHQPKSMILDLVVSQNRWSSYWGCCLGGIQSYWSRPLAGPTRIALPSAVANPVVWNFYTGEKPT